MRYLFNELTMVERELKRFFGRVLMFDFDGTLSSLASTPRQAILSKDIKHKLQKCLKNFSIVIISGRSLNDIKTKVGLKKIIYAGNHGLEWQIAGKISYVPLTKKVTKTLATIKQKFKILQQSYHNILIEDKFFSLTAHYRQLEDKLVPRFKRDVAKVIKTTNCVSSLQVLNGKKVIELRPNIDWDKGKFTLLIMKYLQKKIGYKLLPIYLGDDTTDEDVFTTLTAGITIRVGRRIASSAKYYVKNTRQVGLFMEWLLNVENINVGE